MLQNIDWWKSVLRRALPLLPPLAAAAVVVFQQVYYPHAQVSVLINILLLTLNLVDFLPTVKAPFMKGSANSLIGTCFITIFALLYNVCIAGVPSPLSDLPVFLDSMCGVWTFISALELAALSCLALYHGRPAKPSALVGAAASAPLASSQPATPPSGGQPAASGQAPAPPNGTPPLSAPNSAPGGGGNHSRGPKLILAAFFLFTAILPLIPWQSETGWMQSVRGITAAVFGSSIRNKEALIVVIAYIVLMFVGAVALYVISAMALYLIAKLSGRAGEQSFFEEYGTPIALLIVVGTGVLAWSKVDFYDAFNGIDLITKLFTWLLIVVVGIISLFVLFEATRLVLKQCTEKGSLLKTSMHLIFVIIMEYTMGLLTGILRIFAVRGIIDDILLFFMPGLADSIGPKVHEVLRKALDDEVEEIAETSKGKCRPESPKSKRNPGFRSIHRRGRK